MKTDIIFVYGTLRPPHSDTPTSDYRYFPAIAPYIRAHQPATLLNARLYDLGTYPAAVPGQGVLQGELLFVDEAALSIADRIEGHPRFFRRKRVSVQSTHGQVEAWIYWAPRELTVDKAWIANGDWFQRAEYTISTSQPEKDTTADMTKDSTLQSVVARFAASPCSWLSTVRPDGRAHSSPIWHVWYRGRAYIVTTPDAVKTANIAENPSVAIAHPDPHSPVIIEGWATAANNLRAELQPLFKAKYDWDIATDHTYSAVIEITPTKLMAWGEHGEGRWDGGEIMQVWL